MQNEHLHMCIVRKGVKKNNLTFFFYYGGTSSEDEEFAGDATRVVRDRLLSGRTGGLLTLEPFPANIRVVTFCLKWYMPIDINMPVAISISGVVEYDLRQYLRCILFSAVSYFPMSEHTSAAQPSSSNR